MRYQVLIRLKGFPPQTEIFRSLTKAKKHTLKEMIGRYLELFNPPSYKKAQLIWWKKKLNSSQFSTCQHKIEMLG